MSNSDLDVESPAFSASGARAGDHVILHLRGNADLGALEALEALLPRLHAAAVAGGAREVTVDMTGLEFMNSSCFRSFVSWMSDVQELPPERQYRIHLVSNPKILWQRRSLHALKCFANDLVDVIS